MTATCLECQCQFEMLTYQYNKSIRLGWKMFCGRACYLLNTGKKKSLRNKAKEQKAKTVQTIIALYHTTSAEDIARLCKTTVASIHMHAARLRKAGKLTVLINKNRVTNRPSIQTDQRLKEKRDKLTRSTKKLRDKSGEVIPIRIDHKTTVYVTPERARTKYGLAI